MLATLGLRCCMPCSHGFGKLLQRMQGLTGLEDWASRVLLTGEKPLV
jgi:hypothetical protein